MKDNKTEIDLKTDYRLLTASDIRGWRGSTILLDDPLNCSDPESNFSKKTKILIEEVILARLARL